MRLTGPVHANASGDDRVIGWVRDDDDPGRGMVPCELRVQQATAGGYPVLIAVPLPRDDARALVQDQLVTADRPAA